MSKSKRRANCRLCSGARMQLVLPMVPTPIADHYVAAEQVHDPQERYPLDLYLCLDCGHVQNLDVVNPDVLFRDYYFRTSASAGLVEHFRRYVDEVLER